MKAAPPVVHLKPHKEGAVMRRHPWIFSGAIARVEGRAAAGDTVLVKSADGSVLGTGFCEEGTIAVKILSFSECVIDTAFFRQALQKALSLRCAVGLAGSADTDCWRLVHSEGDGLPGLVIDIYGRCAVVQAQTEGMALHLKEICEALTSIDGLELLAVYNKSSEAMKRMGKEESIPDGYLYGSAQEDSRYVLENGMKFDVDFVDGQKTGFFLDQRCNRDLLRRMSQGRRVLNTFCYTGGFSVAALKGGAKSVTSVDCSAKAIEACRANLVLNGYDAGANPCIVADAKEYLQQMPEGAFDIMVLDPPAFAKKRSALHNGLMGYRFINREAIRKMAPGGLLFTFSCSQAVGSDLFLDMATAAAIEVGRSVQVLYRLSQPADHPVSIFHPEGEYLKGLVLKVD
ncbi:MAG: class I SAM-dependent rRNA methyltransferase [Bacteroidales bacterium]|nr:class I SAM-dependent rRNA methyltransferase [Bacteroidales bacterium]